MNWGFPDNRFPELCSGKYFILAKAYFSDCIVSSVLIEACRRTRRVMQEVKEFIRGWIGYFRAADMKRTLMSWDKWMRRRFRMYIRKQWKKPKTKAANLRKLGVPADKAYRWGNSRLGCWRIAGSPVLKCSITNERLAAAGYFSILSYYESLRLCG